jgi:hypothetical protein
MCRWKGRNYLDIEGMKRLMLGMYMGMEGVEGLL